MTLAILELNDQALLIQSEDGQSHMEPGFAQLTPTGIESGDSARASAWKNPQDSFNQHWRQLNQLPLPRKQNWARHHGDIAYAQIKHMLESVGSPSNVILAVPGCFTDDQLALLLGLAQAIPVQVDGVIDSALAIGLHNSKQTLLIDLQLQQSVVTLLSTKSGTVDISAQEIVPDLGIMTIYNGVARHISDRLIDDYRHDPLHTSEGEQAIYDQLPNWLMQLGWESEISVSLPSPRGELPLILRTDKIGEIIEQRLISLNSIIKKYPNANISFAHSARLIPAILPRFSNAEVMSQASSADNSLAAQQQIVADSKTLHRITSLKAVNGKTKSARTNTKANSNTKQHCATHLLHQNHAWPLDKPLSISLLDEQLTMANGIDNKAVFVAVIENHQLRIMHQSAEIAMEIPGHCEPGQEIIIAGHRLCLIEVSNA